MKRVRLFLAALVFLLSASTQADSLRNSDFLKFSEGEQHWWYAGAFESIGHMVFLHDKQKAQCVWRWLPTEPEKKKALLRQSFEQYPDHSPTSILIALLQKSCGKLLPDS
ncbi:MAG: hypothetical protein KF908_15435 [Nitrosomonas sp.]|nr:hypothetical protein [Nitrosomonas sp.]MCW5608921.1 hypothetical protein [Nitrosomonas sp.]